LTNVYMTFPQTISGIPFNFPDIGVFFFGKVVTTSSI
jgi:hypothetical protein